MSAITQTSTGNANKSYVSDKLTHFTTKVRDDLIERMRRFKFVHPDKTNIDIVNEALEMYLSQHPLPEIVNGKEQTA